MTARKATTAAQCANPLCRLMIYADNLDALELAQVQPDPDRPGATRDARWRLCGIGCARQYLALCELRHAARAGATA